MALRAELLALVVELPRLSSGDTVAITGTTGDYKPGDKDHHSKWQHLQNQSATRNP